MKVNKIIISCLVLVLTSSCANQGLLQDVRFSDLGLPKIDLPFAKSPWREARELELTNAQIYANSAGQLGLSVVIKTMTEHRLDDNNNVVESMDTLKTVLLRPLANDKIARGDEVWAKSIRELAKTAALSNASEPFQIVANVTTSNKKKIQGWIEEGVDKANTGKRISIEYFTTQKTQDTVIFYHPLGRG